MRLSRSRPTLVLVSFTMVGALAACGSSGSNSGGTSKEPAASPGGSAASVAIEGVPTIKADAKLQAMLPEKVAKAGELTVATNAPFPPYEMFASETDQTVVGLEPDLGHAIGNLLGVRFNFVQQPFDGLIPGLQAGKQDVIMSTLFDTAKREQIVDMVNYSASGSGILVTAGNPLKIAASGDLCGKTVAVQTGSAQVAIVEGFSAACTGGDKVTVKSLPQYSDELLALSTGQAQAVVGDIPAISYSLAEKVNTGKFELVTDPAKPNGYESAPVGVAVAKNSGMTKPIEAALQQLMDDGTYKLLLKKWDVEAIAIDKVTVNAASSS